MPEQAAQPDGAASKHAGVLIVIVGASGVGKDSLIAYAREKLAAEQHILFVRRVVTRPALAEDHDTLSREAFEEARAADAFAVCWEAHGLLYGIPAEALRHVAEGNVAVVNGSRAALPAIRSLCGNVVVVHITCRPDIIERRLAARQRESAQEVLSRLARGAFDLERGDVEIDNSADLAPAGDRLAAVVLAGRDRSAPALAAPSPAIVSF